MERNEFSETEILKGVMKETGTTQVKMHQMLGYGNQSTVSTVINSTRMSLDKFVEFLYMMGYEVVVRDHYDRGGSEWRVKVKGHEWPKTTEIAVVKAPGEDL